jgi:polygalacturonase
MTRRSLILCVVLALTLSAIGVQASVFDVREYGAVGDGKTLDTDAINKAVNAAAAAGGGTVHFPAGTYLSFSIRLKSNIALYLDQGATLLAAEPNGTQGYDRAEANEWGDKHKYQDFGHSHWHDSLIWGENLENISILGPGLIHGKGLRKWDSDQPGVGNKAVALKLCRNVIIRDVTFLAGGHFCILPTGVDNFTVDNIKIDTNRDGINVDCCRNVRISNCTINSPNDDAIVLKSSFALGCARATENVTITNCQVTGYNEGTLLDGTFQRTQERAPDRGGVTGRIKFGTESNGGFKNITISNCVFDRCRGLALETVDGGLLEDVKLSNIRILVKGGVPKVQASVEVPELEDGYPDPKEYGQIPAYGFFIRHAKGIELNNVDVAFENEDSRPAFILDDVKGAEFNNVDAQTGANVPTFVLKQVEDFSTQQCGAVPDVKLDRVEKKEL